MIARVIPEGWHVVIDHAWVWLEGKATKPVRAVIWTDFGTPLGREKKVPAEAGPRVEGWTSFDHRYLPIGGILAMVKATRRVQTDPRVRVNDDGTLYVSGCIEPAVEGVPITIEVTDKDGRSELYFAETNADGCYDLRDQKVQIEPGEHTIQVFVTAGGDAAETESAPIKIVA